MSEQILAAEVMMWGYEAFSRSYSPLCLSFRLFRKSFQWMDPEVEARWKLGHMTASRKAR